MINLAIAIASSVTLLSVASDGTPFRQSTDCRISANGRYVVMDGHPATWAPGLSVKDLVTGALAPVPFVPGVTSGWLVAISMDGNAILYDAGPGGYVYDQSTGATDFIPVGGSGLSPDGRYVFDSSMGPLMMHDRVTGADVQLAPQGYFSAISQDNRFVAFSGGLLDRSTGKVDPLPERWSSPTISGDGRYVAYSTKLPSDIMDPMHARIFDRLTGRTKVIYSPQTLDLHFTHDGHYLLLTNGYSGGYFSSLYSWRAPSPRGELEATWDSSQFEGLSIADDGERIAFTRFDPNNGISQSYLLTR